MKSDKTNRDKMSKMRWDKKEEIIIKLQSLQSDLEDYLEIWKKTGGGVAFPLLGQVENRRISF